MADDPKVPTASEVNAQIRDLVAQTHALVSDIDDVVDTLHDHSASLQKQTESEFYKEEERRHG